MFPADGESNLRHLLPALHYTNLSPHKNLVHATFTRKGGISLPPFDTLNVSFEVGDHPQTVSKNLAVIQAAMGADSLFFLRQVHGTKILKLRNPLPLKSTPADAMITNLTGIALLVKQADCQGVILFDPKTRVIAVVHCGWRGNVQNILAKTVHVMRKDFLCKAGDILAAIGPSLGPCCAEFKGYKDIFPRFFADFMTSTNHFDLWAISVHQMTEAGLCPENIHVSKICTKCSADLFYSYRKEAVTGRFATVAMLRRKEQDSS